MMKDEALLQQWMVACRASDVTEEPLQLVVMGERVVLFRTSTGIAAFKDLCIHRGAALSHGKVVNDCLVCPYHGWEYEQEGGCVHIPQLPEGRAIPKKAKAITYACEEKYGLVWVHFGTPTSNILDLPEYQDATYHHVVWGNNQVHAKPPRIIENFLDVGHLAVVHEGFLGDEEHQEIPDYKVHKEENRIYSNEIAIFQPDPDGSGQAKYVYYTYEIFSPLSVRFIKREPETNQKMSILLTVRPQTEETSVAYGLLSFNYDTGQTDEEIVRFQDMIFNQDKPIVENQKPEDLPLDLQVELSLVCDRVSIAYRQYLRQMGVELGTN
ncbi:aromatic ring-hydroxylating oxygenase subunit alpha [Pontibacillus litoralis]|uniref:2Fe-2S ferredoxin n=1 Tax=Pontibacillus litoralis JSM 072002 TaxID=1385512 RepID=A0A0A5G7B0_9BACI|nr:aromatic ring-hydroxylating dioxygenase subunit alpha [Pontibacillus litoralis]KGX87043.1 2Fe-2S ferredoxin [Pontibacillus litoralis JSM 072002]